MLKHQGHDNPTPKTVAAVESQLKRVHGSKLIGIFLDHYQDWNIQYNGHIPHTCPIDGESEGIQSKNMSGSISKSNTNTNPNPNSNSKTEETTEVYPVVQTIFRAE